MVIFRLIGSPGTGPVGQARLPRNCGMRVRTGQFRNQSRATVVNARRPYARA